MGPTACVLVLALAALRATGQGQIPLGKAAKWEAWVDRRPPSSRFPLLGAWSPLSRDWSKKSGGGWSWSSGVGLEGPGGGDG